MMEPGIKILIQRWEGTKTPSAHLTSADILKFGVAEGHTPTGNPAAIPLTDYKTFRGLVSSPYGCWLTAE